MWKYLLFWYSLFWLFDLFKKIKKSLRIRLFYFAFWLTDNIDIKTCLYKFQRFNGIFIDRGCFLKHLELPWSRTQESRNANMRQETLCMPPFTFLITCLVPFNVMWIQNRSRWERVSFDTDRDPWCTLMKERLILLHSINASAREIVGNECRGYPRRAPVLFRGFNDNDDGTIFRSTIIAVMRLSLFSGEQIGISLNLRIMLHAAVYVR